MERLKIIFLTTFIITASVERGLSQLVINVSSGADEANVYREKISGNTSTDSVTVEFRLVSGVSVTQVTDFSSGVTLTRVTVPGERELGQEMYQVLCFVTPGTGDMIPAEAVSKLRQKHSGVTRVAEESRGRVVIDNSVSLAVNKAHSLSPFIPSLCREAAETTFVPDHLLTQLKSGAIGSKKVAKKDQLLVSHNNDHYGELERCASTDPRVQDPCLCVVEVCVHWYPCSLKYCRNNNSDAGGEHRCGIRTCSRCSEMRFTARNKQHCSWDTEL